MTASGDEAPDRPPGDDGHETEMSPKKKAPSALRFLPALKPAWNELRGPDTHQLIPGDVSRRITPSALDRLVLPVVARHWDELRVPGQSIDCPGQQSVGWSTKDLDHAKQVLEAHWDQHVALCHCAARVFAGAGDQLQAAGVSFQAGVLAERAVTAVIARYGDRGANGDAGVLHGVETQLVDQVVAHLRQPSAASRPLTGAQVATLLADEHAAGWAPEGSGTQSLAEAPPSALLLGDDAPVPLPSRSPRRPADRALVQRAFIPDSRAYVQGTNRSVYERYCNARQSPQTTTRRGWITGTRSAAAPEPANAPSSAGDLPGSDLEQALARRELCRSFELYGLRDPHHHSALRMLFEVLRASAPSDDSNGFARYVDTELLSAGQLARIPDDAVLARRLGRRVLDMLYGPKHITWRATPSSTTASNAEVDGGGAVAPHGSTLLNLQPLVDPLRRGMMRRAWFAMLRWEMKHDDPIPPAFAAASLDAALRAMPALARTWPAQWRVLERDEATAEELASPLSRIGLQRVADDPGTLQTVRWIGTLSEGDIELLLVDSPRSEQERVRHGKIEARYEQRAAAPGETPVLPLAELRAHPDFYRVLWQVVHPNLEADDDPDDPDVPTGGDSR